MSFEKKDEIKYSKTVFRFNFIKILFYMFIFSVVIFTFFFVVPILRGVIIAFIIAYLIEPIVAFFERKHIPRGLVIILIFILIIGLFVLLFFLIRLYFPSQNEITQVKNKIVKNLGDLKTSLTLRYSFIDWDGFFNDITKSISEEENLSKKLPVFISSIAADVFSLVIIIPFCIFFFLLSGREIKRSLFKLIPNKYFEMSYSTLAEVDNVFGNYIRGTLLECFIIGLLTSIGFFIIGFPISIALLTGTIAGLANAIPYFGPLLGLIVGIAVCILDLIPVGFRPIFGLNATIVGVVIVVFIVQTIDNVIVKPTVIGKSVDLHPLIVILGVMAGSAMFGFVGLLAAIPVIAIIKVVIQTLYKQLRGFGYLKENVFVIINKKIIHPGE